MNFRLDKVGKEFTGNTLFEGVTISCNPSERIGLVGRNGSGKTTLLDIIDGSLQPDSGQVHRISRLAFSRVRQLYDFSDSRSVLDEALDSFESLHVMSRRLRELEIRMSESDSDSHQQASREYASLSHRFEMFGGYNYKSRAEKMLLGLGFERDSFSLPAGRLSGGQKNRLALAKALLEPADVMLLDEPTNHLDLRGIFWLARFLRESVNSFVLISHDRSFLDSVTNKTWELESGILYEYSVPYSRSREIRDLRLQQQEKQYNRQQEWKTRTEEYIRRNMAGQKTKQAQSRLKRLKKTVWVEKGPGEERAPAMKIPPAPRGGSLAFSLQDSEIGFPGVSLVRDLNISLYRGDRVGLLGGNGSGKSTLLRTVAGELPLISGNLEWGANNVTSYFAQEADFGSADMTVMEWIGSLNHAWDLYDIYSFAALFHFSQEDTEKRIGFLSGGERSRLRFARLFSCPANVMLLDEPTNHLDIESREALEKSLRDYDGTLLVVSHDIYFMKQTVERFYLIRDEGLEEIRDLDDLAGLLEDKNSRETRENGGREWKEKPGLSKNQITRLKGIIKKAEENIERLEAEKVELSRRMQQGSDGHQELAEMGRRFNRIEEELAELMEKWEEAHGQLE